MSFNQSEISIPNLMTYDRILTAILQHPCINKKYLINSETKWTIAYVFHKVQIV